MLLKTLFFIPLYLYLSQAAATNQPTCSDMTGAWINQINSTLEIKAIDPHTGKITGDFTPAEGKNGEVFEVTGWVNYTPSGKQKDSVHPIAFSVNWGEYGSIASWSGYCYLNEDAPAIQTVWNLTRANSKYRWDHMTVNSDIFRPK